MIYLRTANKQLKWGWNRNAINILGPTNLAAMYLMPQFIQHTIEFRLSDEIVMISRTLVVKPK